jgi:hypothetical protein
MAAHQSNNLSRLASGDRAIDINELSRMLSLSPGTIRNRICNNSLPIQYFKINGRLRFWITDIAAFIDSQAA